MRVSGVLLRELRSVGVMKRGGVCAVVIGVPARIAP